MACRTVRSPTLAEQVRLTHERCAIRNVEFLCRHHSELVLVGPQMRRRIAVAFEAPLHFERRLAPHQRHPVNAAVTFDAANALRDVDAVVKIDEAGKEVHPRPRYALSGARARANRFKHRRIGEELRMACHADVGRWYSGKLAALDGLMAVAAIDAVIADVMFVAEGNRLLQRFSDSDGSAVVVVHPQNSCCNHDNRGNQRKLEAQNSMSRENLSHQLRVAHCAAESRRMVANMV